MLKNLAVIALGAILCASCSGAPAPPPFKVVADNKLLMQSVIDPSADLVWDAVKTIITRDKTEEIRPRTTEEWIAVRNAAVALTESGNLLMMAPRAKDGGDWMKFAQELVDAASAALRATEAKDADRLLDVGGPIDEVCERCHKKYWPNY